MYARSFFALDDEPQSISLPVLLSENQRTPVVTPLISSCQRGAEYVVLVQAIPHANPFHFTLDANTSSAADSYKPQY